MTDKINDYDDLFTVSSSDELIFDVGEYIDFDTSLVTLTSPSSGMEIQGDITIVNTGCETISIMDTIREQRLQIEALTDIINEMVEKKDFNNIDCDVNKRVEQKKFLHKLSKDA